jgi:hypothetical protein
LELEEFRLIAAARAGDKPAYGQLVRRNQVAVYHAAYLFTGSAQQAQTVATEAFVRAWSSLQRLPAAMPFAEWVLSVEVSDARATPRDAADLPPAPDMCGAVLAQLDDCPRRRRPPGLGSVAAVAAILAIAATLVVPALRRTAHTHTGHIARALSHAPLARAERFQLGRRIPLTAVRHAAGFTALMPQSPSEAYLARDVGGGRVSVFAGRVLITEFRGTMFPYILSLIGPGIHAQLTWVNGRPGAYGSSVHARTRGDVLTWVEGPLTVRIEGAGNLEQALALARTLR